MNSKCSRLIAPGLLGLLLAAVGILAPATGGTTSRDSYPSTRGIAELATRWLEWVTPFDVSINPIFDSNGQFASLGRSDGVWFLAGTAGGAAERWVTVPADTPLFFPIVNYYWINSPETGDEPWSPAQEAYVRSLLAPLVDQAHDILLEVDGRSFHGIDRLRVATKVGMCIVPDEVNVLFVKLDPRAHECVGDGFWASLPPLPVGKHTIHFSGAIGDWFDVDVIYHVTVKRSR